MQPKRLAPCALRLSSNSAQTVNGERSDSINRTPPVTIRRSGLYRHPRRICARRRAQVLFRSTEAAPLRCRGSPPACHLPPGRYKAPLCNW
jgi:hypothetical protein